jgi:hypothetical protein
VTDTPAHNISLAARVALLTVPGRWDPPARWTLVRHAPTPLLITVNSPLARDVCAHGGVLVVNTVMENQTPTGIAVFDNEPSAHLVATGFTGVTARALCHPSGEPVEAVA